MNFIDPGLAASSTPLTISLNSSPMPKQTQVAKGLQKSHFNCAAEKKYLKNKENSEKQHIWENTDTGRMQKNSV